MAGCEKEHTGYLFTENARYPIDSLKIIRYEDYNQEVIRLEEQLNSYSGEILDSLNAYRAIEAEEEKITEELDRLEGIMNKHGEKLNAYLDQFADESDADPDRAGIDGQLRKSIRGLGDIRVRGVRACIPD